MAETKRKQTMRYTDEELSLIKNTFSENEELIKAIRKVFLQLPLNAVDQSMLIPIKDHKEIADLIRKAFLPTLDGDAPLNQLADIWMFAEIKGKSIEDAMIEVATKQKLIEYLEQQLEVLSNGKEEKIKLQDCLNFKGKKPEEVYSNLCMRNFLIAHTEMRLNEFQTLAGLKNETPEQTLERLRKDSSK